MNLNSNNIPPTIFLSYLKNNIKLNNFAFYSIDFSGTIFRFESSNFIELSNISISVSSSSFMILRNCDNFTISGLSSIYFNRDLFNDMLENYLECYQSYNIYFESIDFDYFFMENLISFTPLFEEELGKGVQNIN